MPVSCGDGGLPSGHIFVQEAGALFGVQAAVSAATTLGDTAMASGYDLGFGSADFTPAHLEKKLVQNVTHPEGKALWACSDAEGLYISSAVAARKRSDGRRAGPLRSALKMGG